MTQLDLNNVAWFLMGDFLRLSPWNVSAQARAQDVENSILRLGFVVVMFIEKEKKHCSCTLYFSLIIVKSLQLHERRKIAEPHKYCLVRVIFFFFTLWHVFSLFCFSQVGNSG